MTLRASTPARTRARRTATVVLSLLAGGLTLPVLSAGPASAATTDQSYWVPVSRSVTIRGHGFGHGHGMSQYGAQGAAKKGLTYRQIMAFYYPRTTWGTVSGSVRVLITSDTTSDVVVAPVPGMTVKDLGTGTTYPLPSPSGVTRWRLAVDSNHRTVVQWSDGAWHTWKPGGKSVLTGDGELAAPSPLRLYTPTGSRTYRGALRAASPSTGSASRDTVNVLSMDDYVRGVIPSEMPPSWQTEAVRSQAVAARTYATWSRDQYPSRYYQICDTTACQVYGGAGVEDSRSNAAVTATAKQILTYGGKPAFTQFSSSSGGWTSSGSVAYLTAKADPYDAYDGNPVHEWTSTVDVARIEKAWPAVGTLRRVHVTRRDGNGEWAGRVWTLVLDGTQGDVTVSGDSFRSVLGLKSSWFSIDPTPIISRWRAIGDTDSPVGDIDTREYRVTGGSVQVFDTGRIFWSKGTGARELYGALLSSYRAKGGVTSPLGYPTSGVTTVTGGLRSTFEHGTLTWNRTTGKVTQTTT